MSVQRGPRDGCAAPLQAPQARSARPRAFLVRVWLASGEWRADVLDLRTGERQGAVDAGDLACLLSRAAARQLR